MRSLYNEEDVEKTQSEIESGSSIRTIKLDKGANAIWILSPKQSNGYVHWVPLEGNRFVRVVCAGGSEGEGWSPEECMLCDYIRSQFAEAREVGNKREAEGIKNFAKRIKARAEVSMIAAKGEMRVMRKRNKKTGKYRDIQVPVFDTDELEVGILKMSSAQYKSFIGLVKNEEYPFIKKLRNLTDRPIIFDKRKRDNDAFPTVECRPGAKSPQELPEEIEFNEDDFDLDALYEVDTEKIEEVVDELTGGSDSDDDEEYDGDDEFMEDDEDEDDGEEDFDDDEI